MKISKLIGQKSAGLLAQINARLSSNKQQTQQQQQQLHQQQQQQQFQQQLQQQQQQQAYYQNQTQASASDGSAGAAGNRPNYQHNNQNIYSDGKSNQNVYQYHPTSHHQHHQNIYVSTNPFITTPRSHYSPSSFGKDTSSSSASEYSALNTSKDFT